MNRTLNERQLRLLRRIAENSKPLLPSEHHLAVSIYALRSRRLVTTTGQRRFWTAAVTDAGRSALELGSLPVANRAPRHGTRIKRSVRVPRSIPQAREATVAEAMERVDPPANEPVTPPVAVTPPVPAAPPAIPVLERLGRPHPIIAATRDGAKRDSDGWMDTMRVPDMLHLRVAPTSLRRVLRIAQSLIHEAQRRGHRVEQRSEDRRCHGGLCIVVDGHPFELTFVEETDRRPHVATKAELDRAARWSYERIPKWDHFPSGRVQLRCGHDAARPLATDRVRWRMEDRLDRALAEIERRADGLVQRAEEEKRRLEQRRLDWEHAMSVARARLVESQRGDLLREQTERWRHASEIRAFIDAVRARDGAPWAVDPKTEAWLTWAAEHADSIDPLLGVLSVPEPPESSPAALEPFLDGWSPYGPDRFGGGYRGR